VAEPINIDQTEAAKRTGLSAKTLERLSNAGERVGRFKVGQRVLFHLATLDAWFRARMERELDRPNVSQMHQEK
jgi:excisionase family DNA binding protein